jgi:Tol biopolymer transport system component
LVIQVPSGEKRKIACGTRVMRPRMSPHALRIAWWTSDANGQRDLWSVAVDGNGAAKLTDDEALDFDPEWSPDGRFVYFSSDRGGNINLWRLPVDEASGRALGAPEPVTNGAQGWSYAASFSRDGKRLAFVAGGPQSSVEKVRFDPVAEVVVGQPTRLARGQSPSAHGDLVTYSTVNAREDIEVISVSGSGRRRLTADNFRNRFPRFSADGSRIAFYSNRGGHGYEAWSIRPDGSDAKQLSLSGQMYYPVWSPDGKRIASCSSSVGYLFDPERAWTEQTPTQLPRLPDGTAEGASFCPSAWSPDGNKLVGIANNSQGGAWLLDLTKNRYQKFSIGEPRHSAWIATGDDGFSTFLSDSRRVLCGQYGRLTLIDTVSGKSHTVLSFPRDWVDVSSLSSNDQWIYYERHFSEGDIWMATLK